MGTYGKRFTEREAARWEREARDAKAQEGANRERAGREAEKLEARVRADIAAAETARVAEAAELLTLSPAQLAAREHRLQVQIPTPGPAKPNGYFLARESVLRRDRAERLERQEREQNLPARRDKYDADVRQINAELEHALGEARRVCTGQELAAQSRADNERAELGARPELEALEAVAA